MQVLNYCRQLVTQASAAINQPNFSLNGKQRLQSLCDLSKASQKFILPNGGRILNDSQLRGLDEDVPLNLPFPFIALEYSHSDDGLIQDGFVAINKHVLFARLHEDCIVITICYCTKHDGQWRADPEIGIPLVGWKTKKDTNAPGVKIRFTDANHYNKHRSVVAGSAWNLMSFLNALSCSNVKLKKEAPKNAGKKLKAAIPFDDYYVLTVAQPSDKSSECVGSSGKSPREHLRRGHIRRYENGLKIWVNATVINAGVGGKITKDYRLTAQ